MLRVALQKLSTRSFLSKEKLREEMALSVADRFDAVSKTNAIEVPEIELFRSSMNDLPVYFFILVAAGLGTWIALTQRVSMGASISLLSPMYSIGLLFLTTIVLLSVMVVRRFNTRFILSEGGVSALRGIISKSHIFPKMEYSEISGTEIRRTVFQRFVGTGDLYVRGLSDRGTEIAFRGIYDPAGVQKIIQERRLVKPALKDHHPLDL